MRRPARSCLYNVPGRTAINLDARTTLRLAQHANIVGIKEASGDLHQIMEILRERPGRLRRALGRRLARLSRDRRRAGTG